MRILTPAAGKIGAEILDFNARHCTANQANAIRNLVYQHDLVVFRDQEGISTHEYLAFARQFGMPQIYLQPHYHHPEHPEIFVSANVKIDGKKMGVSGTGRYWHSDYQFMPEPLSMTMLYPQVWPGNFRETYYIDMVRVLETLPQNLRCVVEDREAIHEGKWRYKIQESDIDRALIDIKQDIERLAPAVTHPAIIQHPVTGLRSLYISSGFTTGLKGLSYEENQAVLADLFSFIERSEHVHTHPWGEHDIVLWDNRPLLHKASTVPKDAASVSYRIGIYDGLPFYVK